MVKPPPSELEIIRNGAPVKEDVKIKKNKLQLVPIRIPQHLLERTDHEVEKRIGLSRNAWILEAIQEKLKKDQGEWD
jgi:hypothetical protein